MPRRRASNKTKDDAEGSATKARQAWMAVLARAEVHILEDAWSSFCEKLDYTVLRAPETGMVMVRARAGGEGQRFNLGEMTVTRCVVRMETGRQGHAYIAGRNKRHAILAATFDALLQDPAHHDRIERSVLAPSRHALSAKQDKTAKKVAATRVDFFTMVHGDD